MSSNIDDDDKLMHSVMDGGDETDDGNLIEDALNQGVGTFIPDMMYAQMTENFSQAKQMVSAKYDSALYYFDLAFKNLAVVFCRRFIPNKIMFAKEGQWLKIFTDVLGFLEKEYK